MWRLRELESGQSMKKFRSLREMEVAKSEL